MRTNFLGWLIFLSYVYVPAARVEEELVVEQLPVLEGDHQQTLWLIFLLNVTDWIYRELDA